MKDPDAPTVHIPTYNDTIEIFAYIPVNSLRKVFPFNAALHESNLIALFID